MSIRTRLNSLEQRGSGDGPFAVQYPGEPVVLRGEEMTREEFAERYPGGTLIKVIYEDTETP